jgi:hypothetical protein
MRLRRLAWVNVVAHALGLALALGMRPGTAVFTVEARMGFLAAAPLAWQAGWGVWMLCALALGAYFSALAAELEPFVRRVALLLVGAAVAVDLLCDAAQLAVLPLAARGGVDGFLVVERAVGVGGALVANGLYTLAAVVVTFTSLRRSADRLLGAALGLAGAVMALAGVVGSARLVELSTGPTIILYCGWALSVARSLD